MIAYILSAMLSVAATQAGPAPSGDRRSLFISPMGEPFRGHATRAAALEAWFVQADKDGNRSLSLKEAQDDAARFFAALDQGQDREIDPADIKRYESEIAPEVRIMGSGQSRRPAYTKVPTGGATGDYGGGTDAGSRGAGSDTGAVARIRKGGPDVGLKGAGQWGLLNIPQPLNPADTNFNRGISMAEFEKAASLRFLLLDTDRDGKLSLDELQARLAELPAGR